MEHCEMCGFEKELGIGGICEDCHVDAAAEAADDDRYWKDREDAAVTEAEYQSSPEDFEE